MKNRRLFTFLAILPILSACSGKLPRLKKIDLSDAVAIFYGLPYENEEIRYARELASGLAYKELNEKGNFYKIDKNGVASVVNFQTNKSENDKEILKDLYFSEMFNVNDEYFYFSPYLREDEYLINKKTGEAIYLKDASADFYDFSSYNSPYYKDTLPKDSKGNIYTYMSINYKTKAADGTEVINFGYGVGKISIDKGSYKEEVLFKDKDIFPYGCNELAVDKDGNIALKGRGMGKDVKPKERYITTDGNVITIQTEEYVKEDEYYHSTKYYFQGYDGEIYSNETNNICRITPLKDNNGKTVSVGQSPIFELPSYVFEAFENPNNLLYIDETKTIILAVDHDGFLEFYSIYGNQAGEKIFSFLKKEDAEKDYSPSYRSKDSLYVQLNEEILRFKFLNEPTVQRILVEGLRYYNRVTEDNKFVYKLYDQNLKTKILILRNIGFYDFDRNVSKEVSNIKFDYLGERFGCFIAF